MDFGLVSSSTVISIENAAAVPTVAAFSFVKKGSEISQSKIQNPKSQIQNPSPFHTGRAEGTGQGADFVDKPEMDAGIQQALSEFVERRTHELEHIDLYS